MADEIGDTQRIRILLELQAEQLTKDAKRAERAVEGIERRFDSTARATQKYERDLRNLDRALAAGTIGQDRYQSALNNVEREYRTATQAAEVFETATARTTQTSGRFAGQMQNASYQVGDFAVQIASGGSAVTALAQQLPQLLGGFGLLGAGLGALVAIGGAAYKLLGDTAEEAEGAEGSVEAFTGALGALANYSEIVGMDLDTLRQKFGDFADDVKENARYLAEVAVAKAVDTFNTGDNAELVAGLKEVNALYAEMAELGEAYTRTVSQRDSGVASSEQVLLAQEALLQISDDADAAAEKLGLTVNQARALGAAFADVDPAGGMEGVRDAAQGVLDIIAQFYPEGAKLPAALVPAVEAMEEIAAKAAQGVAVVEKTEAAVASVSASWLDAKISAVAAGETAQVMLSSLQDQAEMQRLIAEYGADSEEVARARADAEREAQEAIVDALAVSDDMKAALMEAWDAANGISDADMAGGISAASTEARALADWLNISLATAARLAAMGPQGTPDNYDGPGAGYVSSGRGGDPRTMGGSAYDRQNAEADEFLRKWKPPAAPKRTGGGGRKKSGGGSSGKSDAQKQLEDYQREAERIYSQTRTAAEAYGIEMERLNTLHQSGALALDTYSRAVEKLDTDLRQTELDRLREQFDGIADSIAGAIVQSDNLGDAFGNMFAQMAQEYIRNGIADMLMGLGGGGGLFGGLFGGKVGSGSAANAAAGSGGLYAKGAAFSGGRVIPFASGGVVSSPTMFPMAGGKMGLMGEAGAEAIMPLARGPTGKLGIKASGGGAQSVHVTVGVSADGNGNLMPFVQSVTDSRIGASNAQRDKAFVGKVNGTRANTHPRRLS